MTVEATVGLSWTRVQCPTGRPAVATRASDCVHGSRSCAVTPCHPRGIVSQLVSEYRVAACVAVPLPGCLYNVQTSQSYSRQGVKNNFGANCNQCDHIGLVSNRKHVPNGRLLLTFFEQFLCPHFIHTVEPLYSTIGGVHEMRSCYRRIVVK